jgi:acetyl-CoA carboxylase biotin carboxyl carrier protein
MDTKELFSLMEKFDASNLTRLVVRKGDTEIVMKKGYDGPVPTVQYANPVSVPVMAPAAAGNPTASSASAEKKASGEFIKAPIVGTFYRSAAPDAPPFVEKGRRVKKGDSLCILEAMKVMNAFEAEFDCEIIDILVGNGTLVEYGTPLFEVRRV